MTKRVAIFDLDGTLTITQELHAEAESRVLGMRGLRMSREEITERFAGISDRLLFKELLPSHDTEALVDEKWWEVYHLIERYSIFAMPGMVELCQQLHAGGHHIAIASASPRDWIERCLEVKVPDPQAPAFSLQRVTYGQFFGSRYVSARDCARGKPFPDVYLAAYAATGASVSLEESWAIGDAVSDVEAGLAAGMQVFFLSDNTRFDSHPRVTRFPTSQLLTAHLCSKITS